MMFYYNSLLVLMLMHVLIYLKAPSVLCILSRWCMIFRRDVQVLIVDVDVEAFMVG